MDTLLGITLICDAGRVAKSHLFNLAVMQAWKLEDCVRRYRKAGYERDFTLAVEWDAEAEARKLGKEKGVRFRRFRGGNIGPSGWPIKAYGHKKYTFIIPVGYGPGFKSWAGAQGWVRGG